MLSEISSDLCIGDIYDMVALFNQMLSSTLSSLVSLGGGLIMCIATSWRLSILAFTTIGPITLVIRIYSKWAKNITRYIRNKD
jgi:ABC-type multidrug transport system fused ATPase/permease subunit